MLRNRAEDLLCRKADKYRAYLYRELLSWWAELREIVDPDRGHEYILWNNKEILIEGNAVFSGHYFDNGVTFTKDLLYDMSNTESFKAIKKSKT